MADNKLTDEQIWKMISEFESLDKEGRKARKIGSGSSKLVYDVPDSDYVLKKVRRMGEDPDVYDNHSIIDEYLANKQVQKTVPTESPILVTKPAANATQQDAYHLQKKLNTSGVDDEMARAIKEKASTFGNQLDISPRNIGLDSEGNAKLIDFYDSGLSIDPTKDAARSRAVEKIANNAKTKPQIYRAIEAGGNMNSRKQALEAFSKQLSEGLPFAEDFIERGSDIENNALLARNLSEDALAHQVLKNTGIPVPNSNAPVARKEDFLNRLVAERYPEIKDPNIRLGVEDSYTPKTGGILVKDRGDLIKETGKAFHEGAHKYDDQILKHAGQELDLGTLRNAKKAGIDLKNMDPAQVYEMYAKGHHARIPDVRDADSFGMGALKSMMKSGTFKQVAGALPVAGGLLAATMSGDASAAVPLLDEADDVGESREDEAALIGESRGFNNYNKSQARMDALKKMGSK